MKIKFMGHVFGSEKAPISMKIALKNCSLENGRFVSKEKLNVQKIKKVRSSKEGGRCEVK